MLRIKRITIGQIHRHLFRCAHDQIQAKAAIQKQPIQQPADLSIRLQRIMYNQQVQITVAFGIASGLGAQQDDLPRMDGFDDPLPDVLM